MMELSHDSRAIANYIIEKAPEYKIENLSPMKLIKLVYLAHGWSLAFSGISMVKQLPEAWTHGPVYPEIYCEVSKYTFRPVKDYIRDELTNQPYRATLADLQRDIIHRVLSTYGQKTAYELSDLTHLSGTPWEYTIDNIGNMCQIPLDVLKNYYVKALQKHKQAKSVMKKKGSSDSDNPSQSLESIGTDLETSDTQTSTSGVSDIGKTIHEHSEQISFLLASLPAKEELVKKVEVYVKSITDDLEYIKNMRRVFIGISISYLIFINYIMIGVLNVAGFQQNAFILAGAIIFASIALTGKISEGLFRTYSERHKDDLVPPFVQSFLKLFGK
ncbi:Panacea domain-containing protein [Candidatus Liberibacter sp.]|uniref:Panacea domain-containing protein n=1 Tax=Candidatus Liberibacter sp. TaxID=34022 RepID=UPI0015F3C369|nr:type II toxin-antitoxin system antitoxin SocA domain-containing protein [Candidatus Liberibacter sp.]MBA5724650.1 SocA family protein [Candidatus Liberibacter sp.]